MVEVAAWAPHLEAPEETRRTVVWRTVALQALGSTCRTEVSCSSSPWAVQAASFLRDLYFNRSYGQPRFRTSQATYLTGTLTMHAHQHCRQQTPQCVGSRHPRPHLTLPLPPPPLEDGRLYARSLSPLHPAGLCRTMRTVSGVEQL